MAGVEQVSATGDPLIDGLLMGTRWDGPLTYAFPTSADAYGYGPERNGFGPLNGSATQAGTQIWAATRAYDEVRSFTLLDLSPAAPGAVADLRLAETTTPGGGRQPGWTAYGNFPDTTEAAGDAWFNTSDYDTPYLGTFAYQTFLHEIGHTLGLKHGHLPGFGNPSLPGEWDSQEFTVMTYRAYVGQDSDGYGIPAGNYPQSYMMLDIRALQELYGADFGFRATDTVYRFNPDNGEMKVDGVGQGVPSVNVIFRTIWDGGGTDTYDFSAYGSGSHLAIDLRPGEWTDVDSASNAQAARLNGVTAADPIYARGQVANALLYGDDARSLIENAIAADGNDSVIGNQADNRLEGRGGDDWLQGLAGSDVLVGGSGNDVLDGGEGSDTADYAASASRVVISLSVATAQNTQGAGFDTLVSIENLVGSGLDDVLRGGADANRIDGGGGNDTIEGGGGDDTLLGGTGSDTADYRSASAAVTVSLAAQGAAQNTSGAGSDLLTGFENLSGGIYADVLTGDDGANTLAGNTGDDTLEGGGGNDRLDGGVGNDWADYEHAAGAVTASLTAGTASGAAGNDTLVLIERLVGSAFADTLTGDGGANILRGLNGNDLLYGMGGDDTLRGNNGDDRLDGGTGTDTADYSQATAAIEVSLAVAGPQETGASARDTLVSIENILGGVADDRLYGDDNANRIDAGTGNDLVKGAGGDDSLFGQAGDDTLAGGDGNDLLNGGDGFDTADYSATVGRVVLNLGNAAAQNTQGAGQDTLSSIEAAIGGLFADALVGNAQDNRLEGREGNDIIEGRGGNDTLLGGAGIDLVEYRAATTGVAVSLALQGGWQDTGGAGQDWLSGFENLSGSAWADRLAGDAGNNVLMGLGGDDRLSGGAGNDVLDGGVGNDVLDGSDGSDTADYSGTLAALRVTLGYAGPQDTLAAGTDRLLSIENVTGGAGADLLWGDNGANRIEGSDGNDFIQGAGGNDTLLGGAGNDALVGGLGADRLELGTGSDTLRYLSAADSRAGAMDTIFDFTVAGGGYDRIGFDNNANALFAGVAASAFLLAPSVAVAAADSLATLAAALAGMAGSTATGLSLAQVDVAGGSMAGHYLAVNDMAAGFDAAADMLIGIQFAGGATLAKANFFLF